MALIMSCPRCQQSLGVPEPQPAQVRCPKCGTTIAIKRTAPPPKPIGPQPLAVPVPTLAVPSKPDAIAAGKPPMATLVSTTAVQAGKPLRPLTPKSHGVAGTAFLVGAGAGTAAIVIIVLVVWALSGAGKKKDKSLQQEAGGKNDGDTPSLDLKLGEPQRKRLPEHVEKCVALGVEYLRTQVKKQRSFHLSGDPVEAGRIALIGLTLLECGVPADDEDVKYAAQFVRSRVPEMKTTYQAAPAILFLDRLHRSKDMPNRDLANVRTLALRLVAGQTRPLNLWNYDVPILDNADETAVLDAMKKKVMYEGEPGPTATPPDLSSSQFAALALWTAGRHKLPVERSLRAAAESIRRYQLMDGSWPYHITRTNEGNQDTGTCVGLILLALGQGVREAGKGKFLEDPDVTKALANLGTIVNRPHQGSPLGNRFLSHGDLYFLWTLERTALIANQPSIGGKDWHAWGTDIIVSQQKPGGYWAEKHVGPVDTCFALLFLVQADLFHDLTRKLAELALLAVPGPHLAQAPDVPGRRNG
jgi:hypothetical protein